MQIVAIVAALALIEYSFFVLMAGRARGRQGIPAPAMTGDTGFERCYRTQANTIEQLVIFLPALFLFGYFVNEPIAAALGLVFILGRALYARAYVVDPAKRGPGFALTFLSNLVLLVGGLVGAVVDVLRASG